MKRTCTGYVGQIADGFRTVSFPEHSQIKKEKHYGEKSDDLKYHMFGKI